MNHKFAQTMKEFFNKIDNNDGNLNLEQVALKFCENFIENTPGNIPSLNIPKNDITNVSILGNNTPLDFITKRTPLLADTTVLSHYGEQEHKFHFSKLQTGNSITSAIDYESTFNIRCPSLNELGKWLIDCRPLLEDGQIYYLPDFTYSQETYDFHVNERRGYRNYQPSRDLLYDIITKSKKMIGYQVQNTIKTDLFRVLFSVDLPYIENIDTNTFAKITVDEPEAAETFRNFLRLRFLGLESAVGSESYEKDVSKIGVELREGVRQLNSDFNLLKKKRSFQVTGATIACVTAVLVALDNTQFGYLPELLGTSGGILAVSKSLQEYSTEKQKTVEDSPYYYLWLLSESTNKY